MGYTHHFRYTNWDKWTPDELDKAWDAFIKDADAIIAAVKDEVELEVRRGDDFLSVNGVGDDAHENLLLMKHPVRQPWQMNPNEIFGFVKTAYKPYDYVIVAILLAAKRVFENRFTISTDGNWGMWSEGRELYAVVFPKRKALHESMLNEDDEYYG